MPKQSKSNSSRRKDRFKDLCHVQDQDKMLGIEEEEEEIDKSKVRMTLGKLEQRHHLERKLMKKVGN